MSMIVYNHLPEDTRHSSIIRQREHETITRNLTILFSKCNTVAKTYHIFLS